MHAKWFTGRIDQYWNAHNNIPSEEVHDESGGYRRVVYSDDDAEDLTLDTINELVRLQDAELKAQVKSEYYLPFLPRMKTSLIEEARYCRAVNMSKNMWVPVDLKVYPAKAYVLDDDKKLDLDEEISIRFKNWYIWDDEGYIGETFKKLMPGIYINDVAITKFSHLFNREELRKWRENDKYKPAIMMHSYFSDELKNENDDKKRLAKLVRYFIFKHEMEVDEEKSEHTDDAKETTPKKVTRKCKGCYDIFNGISRIFFLL